MPNITKIEIGSGQHQNVQVSVALFNQLVSALEKVVRDYLHKYPQPETTWQFFASHTNQPIARQLQKILATVSGEERLLYALQPLFKKFTSKDELLLNLHDTLCQRMPLMAQCHELLQQMKHENTEQSGESSYLTWDVDDYQHVITVAATELRQSQNKQLFALSTPSVDSKL